MNEFYQENKTIVFIFAGFLIITVIVLYFWLVQPLKADLDRTNQNIKTLEDDKVLVTTQINNYDTSDVDIDIDELLYEKKIPRDRNLDDYILALQGLEFITSSKIESVGITYDSGTGHIEVEEDEVEEETAPAPDSDEAVEDDEVEETVEEEESVEQPVIDPVIVKEKPESLEVMVVTISAVSPNFEEFLHLIEAIESQDRVSIVSNLNFNSPTENDIYTSEYDVDTKKIEFTASLTTFYYPEQ